MIRLLVELWPGGDAERAILLGQVAIANATPHDDPASYVAAVVNPDGELICSHVVTAIGGMTVGLCSYRGRWLRRRSTTPTK